MGGVGSGAKRSTKVGDVEDALALDIRVLRRLGVLRPGECVIDTIYWQKRGLNDASARLRADLGEIEHGGVLTVTGVLQNGAISQRIAIDAVQSSYGGHRCYFMCPITEMRCEVLYYWQGRFASRNAHRLTYATQNMTDLSRARCKAARLRRRLKGEGGQCRPRGKNRIRIVEQVWNAEYIAKQEYFRLMSAR